MLLSCIAHKSGIVVPE
jgi:rRNA-processing protein EBP2